MPLWGGGTAWFCSFLSKPLALHSLSASQPLSISVSQYLSLTQPYSALLSPTQPYSALLSPTQCYSVMY
ncbi:MAG: hypothetical protein R3Y61_02820 [Rikenellaceae bacterium]